MKEKGGELDQDDPGSEGRCLCRKRAMETLELIEGMMEACPSPSRVSHSFEANGLPGRFSCTVRVLRGDDSVDISLMRQILIGFAIAGTSQEALTRRDALPVWGKDLDGYSAGLVISNLFQVEFTVQT